MALLQEHSYPVPVDDLDRAVDLVGSRWARLDGMRLLFTGGTGFVGTWMVAVLLRAVDRGILRAQASLLTRDPEAFAKRAGGIVSHGSIRLLQGDVLRSGWNADGCSHLVAGATEASAALLKERPRLMLETILDGTRRTLDVAAQTGISRALFLSSGAANGPQSPEISLVQENEFFGPDPLLRKSAYGEGKRAAEMLFALAGSESFSFSVSRMWAFVGPLLLLNTHFAIGNFIGDALAGRTIRILGDGTTVRSYQYAADMAAWNWILLASGRDATAYNVGSDRAVSTRELAEIVSKIGAGAGFEVLGKPDPARRVDVYVPSVDRFVEEFTMAPQTDLETAISRTIAWNRAGGGA
ncbi:MAG: NAD-dependent epimerase/dehydratase family protein [Fibrobacteres bacterium]|jgi:UDP-glucuronate decarboxylase|nr:NAD-dependent epimerase/dehydratase family protein [Fibrobacterota bacterium]